MAETPFELLADGEPVGLQVIAMAIGLKQIAKCQSHRNADVTLTSAIPFFDKGLNGMRY